MNCDELLPLLAARGAIEDDERATVESHLRECARCPALARDLADACAIPPRRAPDRVWDAIAAGLEEERVGPTVRVLLRCTFCHAGLGRDEASYCAACLAPHHADCFEQHGRCAAPGCAETRTVAPRAARRRRARWPLVVVAAVAAGAAAFAPRGERSLNVEETLATLDEPTERAPYPWPEPDDRLLSRKLSCNFTGTPVEEVLEFLHDLTELEMKLDPRLPADAKVTLCLRDVSTFQLLRLVVASLPDAGFVIEEKGVTIVPRAAFPAERVHPQPFYVRELLDEGRGATSEVRRRLTVQKVNLNLDATPLGEVVQLFHDLTGQNFVLDPKVDPDGKAVSLRLRDVPVEEALEQALRGHGLTWEVQREVVRIVPRSEEAGSTLAGKRVSVELRGVTPSALALELARQGVETVATREAWGQSGTLSVIARDLSVERLIATIASQTTLRPWVATVSRAPRREVLVLDGTAASVRDALTLEPPPFAGVAQEIADLRARLLPAVAARAAARRGESEEELLARERTVDLSASRIIALDRRARFVAKARSRFASTDRQLAKVKDELSAAREAVREHAKMSTLAYERREARIATARAVLDGLRACAPLAEQALAVELAAIGVSREQRDDLLLELAHWLDHERLLATGVIDGANDAALDAERQNVLTLTRLENEGRKLELRRDELIRETGALAADIEVLRELERGARLGEAERGR